MGSPNNNNPFHTTSDDDNKYEEEKNEEEQKEENNQNIETAAYKEIIYASGHVISNDGINELDGDLYDKQDLVRTQIFVQKHDYEILQIERAKDGLIENVASDILSGNVKSLSEVPFSAAKGAGTGIVFGLINDIIQTDSEKSKCLQYVEKHSPYIKKHESLDEKEMIKKK
jgi:hypothetical protein